MAKRREKNPKPDQTYDPSVWGHIAELQLLFSMITNVPTSLQRHGYMVMNFMF